MAIKEQKLFFTRNGEFTLWEMLEHLNQEQMEGLHSLSFSKGWTTFYVASEDNYASFFWRMFENDVTPEDRPNFIEEVSKLFQERPSPLSDFNGIVYHYKGTSYDTASALYNLENLLSEEPLKGFEGLDISIFDRGNIVDVRFTTKKLSTYKSSDIDQIIHTEIRVYLEKNLAVMTNFSNYTHKDSEKSIFISEVIKRVSSHRGPVSPVKFSDSLMRKLLASTGSVPTKFKFDIEDRMRVGFQFKDVMELEEMIRHDEFRRVYQTASLKSLGIQISPFRTDKQLQIDGNEGKILTRTKNLEDDDINTFIVNMLSPLLKFDYLNEDYKLVLRKMAIRNLDGIRHQKELIANQIYQDISIKANQVINDDTGIRLQLIINTFIFCLDNKIRIAKQPRQSYTLENKSIGYLVKMTGFDEKALTNLFSNLLNIYEDNNAELNDLFEQLDVYLNSSREG